MRSWMVMIVLIALCLGGWPERAMAQVARAAIGTGVGVAGGVVVTMSVVVARARFQGVYLDSGEDLIHWQSAPMLIAPAAGLVFGLAGKDPLRGSIIGSTSGLLVGAAAGAVTGWLVSATPEGPWAGGVIGAGLGMTIGGLGLGIKEMLEDRNQGPDEGGDDPTRIIFTLPL